jgi:hypothetical protein
MLGNEQMSVGGEPLVEHLKLSHKADLLVSVPLVVQ